MHHSKSNVQENSHMTDPDVLFHSNRSQLKSIFAQHNPHENRISFSDFCKFCKNTQIFPVKLN